MSDIPTVVQSQKYSPGPFSAAPGTPNFLGGQAPSMSTPLQTGLPSNDIFGIGQSSPSLQDRVDQAEQEAKSLNVNVPDPTQKQWTLWDLLNVARQPITEALYTATKEAGQGDINWGDVLKSAIYGVGADLPILGNQIGPAYRHTSSDVIKLMFPNSPQWVQKVGGLVGDILTDPLTYLTFGAGGGVKGAAEAGHVGEEAVADMTKQIAEDTSGKVAQSIMDQYGGKTLSEALMRAKTATTKEAGNYGLRIGIPFTNANTLVAPGTPTDWVGNLLKSLGAPEAGKAVQGLGTTIANLPIVSNLNKAFNTAAPYGPFTDVKDLVFANKAQTSLDLEKATDTLKDVFSTADTLAKDTPELASVLTSANLPTDGQGALEALRQVMDNKMPIPEVLQPLADKVNGITDDLWQQMLDRGMVKAEDKVENYFPRYLENGQGQKAIVAFGDNPVTAGFTKERTFDTLAEAQAAGYQPVNALQSLGMYESKANQIINNHDLIEQTAERYGKELPLSASAAEYNAMRAKGFAPLEAEGFQQTWVPQQLADILNNTTRVVTDPDEATKFFGFLNNIQNGWKKMVTQDRPAFYSKVLQSNTWVYGYKDGFTPKNVELFQKAIQIERGKGSDALITIALDGQDVTHTANDWWEMMRGSGVDLGTKFGMADLNDAANKIGQQLTTAQKVWQAPGQVLTQVGAGVHNTFRVASALSDMNKGLDITDAAKNVAQWFHDYGDLTSTEQTIRKFIPFYSWLKKNLVNQFRAMLTEPGKYTAFTSKLMNAIDFSTPEQQQYLAPWQKAGNAINPFGIQVGGKPLMLTSALPFRDVNDVASGNPLSSLYNIITGGLSPLIKTPIELATNKSLYSGKEIAPSPQAVSPVPAVLNAIVGVMPDPVKQALGIQQDKYGQWSAPAKWIYALNALGPLVNMTTGPANLLGAPGAPYAMEKAPYSAIATTSGFNARPFDLQQAKDLALQQRLRDLNDANRAAMTDKLNAVIRAHQAAPDTRLQAFAKQFGYR